MTLTRRSNDETIERRAANDERRTTRRYRHYDYDADADDDDGFRRMCLDGFRRMCLDGFRRMCLDGFRRMCLDGFRRMCLDDEKKKKEGVIQTRATREWLVSALRSVHHESTLAARRTSRAVCSSFPFTPFYR